jgi:hypothetical protein
MQINVIHNCQPESFNFVMYPEKHPETIAYLQREATKFYHELTDIGKSFIDQSKRAFEAINNSETMRAAKAVIRKVANLFHPNSVYFISNLDDIRFAQSRMQHFIMAEPSIRQAYLEKRCDGYSDSYIDPFPEKIKEDHYTYRRATDGLFVETSDGGLKSTTWFEDLLPGDRNLTLQEKCDIVNTWSIVNMFVSNGLDPTSIYSEELG